MTKPEPTADRAEPMRVRLLQARLFNLQSLVDESGVLVYHRRLHLMDSSRRVLFLIGVYGGLTALELARYSGSEKAQISRGIKSLADLGLIDRPTLRSRITLSAEGERTFWAIMEISHERDEMLRTGIDDGEVARFIGLTSRLIERAAVLYAREAGGASPDGDEVAPIFVPPNPTAPDGTPRAAVVEFNRMILCGLQSLTTYLRRGSTQIYKREVGLSSFEWQVLSQIGEYQPTTLAGIVDLVRRNKSQVGRTLKELQATGLLERQDRGRTNVSLVLTGEGNRIYDHMCDLAIQRHDFLVESFDTEQRRFYLDTVDRVRTNARRILSVERVGRAQPVNKGSLPSRSRDIPSDAGDISALREENARLKRLLAEAVLEISVLKERLTPAAQ